MSVLGLAALIDENPSWELTPLWKRMLGKPKWRAFMYVTGEWVYRHNKPVRSYGINRTSNHMWHTHVYASPQTPNPFSE